MNYAAKVMGIGVFAKAVLMTTVVLLLGATTFTQSVILVLVSATATGIFALLVVLIQIHSERSLHERLDKVEAKTQETAQETQAVITQAKDEVVTAVTPNGETK